ncbi:copper amine oxidase N-terminal domain-containing protein [Paenibacillus sp.]|uniref:copper amine oxidase N-terminal domain-containing protein n=1 Tax=Paenibacillus sp. TaxID=58172 RepID=UPI002D492BE2|nr:copper amine oxidase N-terminal domain-containing protein [Paenibacillus sp.]HZG88025.1 copper amine oxidase N-terminal domain-containing protein [Paenibacillus sp.]
MDTDLLVFPIDPVSSSAARGDPEVRVYVNTEPIAAAGAVIRGGRALVPLRVVAEGLGAAVDWDPADRKVTIRDAPNVVELRVGSRTANVYGLIGNPVRVELDEPAVVEGGRTLVPLRFVGESLYVDVAWYERDRSVYISETGVNLTPDVWAEAVYSTKLESVEEFGKPTVRYEKFIAMELESISMEEVRLLFAQEPIYHYELGMYEVKSYIGGARDRIIFFDERFRWAEYAGDGLPLADTPAVTEDRFARLETGMSYESVRELLGGDGVVTRKGADFELHRWRSASEERDAVLRFGTFGGGGRKLVGFEWEKANGYDG